MTGSGAAITASASRRLSASSSVTGSSPFWHALLKKISPKPGAITQRMPKRMSAHTAPSRELPQPKFGPAIRISLCDSAAD